MNTAAAEAPKKLRILFNSDCGAGVFYRHDAPMSPEQLCAVVNEMKGTQVDKSELTFSDASVKQGENELTVSLHGREGKAPGRIRVEGIEVFVEYIATCGR